MSASDAVGRSGRATLNAVMSAHVKYWYIADTGLGTISTCSGCSSPSQMAHHCRSSEGDGVAGSKVVHAAGSVGAEELDNGAGDGGHGDVVPCRKERVGEHANASGRRRLAHKLGRDRGHRSLVGLIVAEDVGVTKPDPSQV
jgi:hypothetical protein